MENKLKYLVNNIPDWVHKLFGLFIRQRFTGNRIYKEYFLNLKQRVDLSEVEVKKLQVKKLREILIYSYKNVPYYQALFDNVKFNPYAFEDTEQLKVLPLMTKETIQENWKSLHSMEKIPRGFYIAKTGGTSGVPTKIALDTVSIFKEHAFINFYRTKLNYTDNSRIATFRGVNFKNSLKKLNSANGELLLSPFKLSRNNIHKYLKELDSYQPDFLNGYLSSIYMLATLLKEKNLKLKKRLKGIFLISENIDVQQRLFVEDFFGVESMTFYGHSERCVIAEEIRKGEFKFDEYYGYRGCEEFCVS